MMPTSGERRRNGERRSHHPQDVTWRDILNQFEAHEESDREAYQAIDRKLDNILEYLNGSNSDNQPGLRLRVDRLEQWKRLQIWLHGLWLAAATSWIVDHLDK